MCMCTYEYVVYIHQFWLDVNMGQLWTHGYVWDNGEHVAMHVTVVNMWLQMGEM